MLISRKLKLSAVVLASTLATLVCSTGYITPASVAATEEALNQAPPTAFFSTPTAKPIDPASPAAPSPTTEVSATPEGSDDDPQPILYSAQSGDSLAVVAAHFGVEESEIASPADISTGFISPGQLLVIPDRLGEVSPSVLIMPDSEVIYSPSAIGFDAESYSGLVGGYLSSYRQYLGDEWHIGGNVLAKVALENSINPRLLLSILEFQSNWVLGHPSNSAQDLYPLGFIDEQDRGLFAQMSWAVNQLSVGYYGWREGRLSFLTFEDGTRLRIAPELNAGTVAVQYFFSRLYDYDEWLEVIDEAEGFPALHKSMFPDPWVRAAQEEPLLTADLSQPEMGLPFFGTQLWSYSSGPHGAWDRLGARAALDFAPSSSEPGCVESTQQITAAAPGLVVRVAPGVVVLDLDGDGNEQTGWAILFLHVSSDNQVKLGTWVDRGTFLGYPSCEGGFSTASHLHIARKYNGEWMNAGGPVPFELSGWQTVAGSAAYLGYLVRGEETRTACTCGNIDASISLSSDDPY
jgi:murein DD-endopeptidase MepM/ murein hydrolase activator NlpD